MNKVIKRDGRKVPFDKGKIIDAIFAAFEEIDGEITSYAEIKAGNIADYIEEVALTRELNIEEIQDYVEKGISSTKRKDVAKAYILYRDSRTRERNKKSVLVREIGEKITASNVQNANANMDERSFGGRKGAAADTLLKDYALNYSMSEMARNNHLNNLIYTHDLDNYSLGTHNCLTIPFDDLLAKGFNTRQTDIRPANSFSTACQLVAVIFQLQSLQQFGGCSASHIDWTLVPYLRKSFLRHYIVAYLKATKEFNELDLISLIFDDYEDELKIRRNKFDDWVDEHKTEFFEKTKLTEKDFYLDNKALDRTLYQSALYDTVIEVKQSIEAMYHNLNSLQSRSGNQLPFTSLNYGTCTSTEGRLIIKAILEGSLNGIGKLHRTPIFPCGIFQSAKGINRKPGEPNYDLFQLALKSTSKRLYPNYANVDWSGNEGYDKDNPATYFSTMGLVA